MLLEDAAQGGMGHIISWGRSGCGFKIHSRNAFETVIMPCYFASTADPKFRSFQRQLNIYGFRVVNDPSSPDFGGYHQPLFQRGKPELCAQMKREQIKSGDAKKKNLTAGQENALLLEFAQQANAFLALKAAAAHPSFSAAIQYKNIVDPRTTKNHQEEHPSLAVVSTTPEIVRKETCRGKTHHHYRSDSLVSILPNQSRVNTLVANEVPQPMSNDRQLFFGDSSFIW
jgi:hypothetical protein